MFKAHKLRANNYLHDVQVQEDSFNKHPHESGEDEVVCEYGYE